MYASKINHPPCNVEIKLTLSLSTISASSLPSSSQSASLINTKIPARLRRQNITNQYFPLKHQNYFTFADHFLQRILVSFWCSYSQYARLALTSWLYPHHLRRPQGSSSHQSTSLDHHCKYSFYSVRLAKIVIKIEGTFLTKMSFIFLE